MPTGKVITLRIIHGAFALYFMACLGYLYYAGFVGRFDLFLTIAVLSLAVEAILVFVVNQGDCPLIHVQRWIGDPKPFFELFLPANLAKQAIPFFAKLTWLQLPY